MGSHRIALVLVSALPLAAQWPEFPAKGVPRKTDGSINLDAPTPRLPDGKPNLSGMWSLFTSTGLTLNITADQSPDHALPWAALYHKRQMEDVGKNDPNTIGCLPMGPRRLTGGGPTKIIHTPNLMVMLSEDLTYRQVFLDGRRLPADPQPSFMGYSVGRWDQDTLVVETTGFNDRTWLDMGGHPHTEALKATERFRRTAYGRMDLTVTLEDPKAYKGPWSIQVNTSLQPDLEFIEYVCNESPQSTHIVGRTGGERITLAPQELAKFVGTYETEGPRKRTYRISLEGSDLLLDVDGRGRIPFIPLAPNTFSPRLGGMFVFSFDAQGAVTQFVSHGADEIVTAIRRR